MDSDKLYDVFVIGGGINGCGIARDAAGRGLSVALAEMGDLASATSSASTKLFHGGLRYLEYFEIGLVRKALIEREVLLSAMPHISWPMRFVLPYHPDMRFEGASFAAGTDSRPGEPKRRTASATWRAARFRWAGDCARWGSRRAPWSR